MVLTDVGLPCLGVHGFQGETLILKLQAKCHVSELMGTLMSLGFDSWRVTKL